MAFKTQTVVSLGWTRALSGSVFGAGIPANAAIVVGLVELRFTRLASASVPIFTGQRSPEHCAEVRPGRKTRRMTQTDDSQRIRFDFMISLNFKTDLLSGAPGGRLTFLCPFKTALQLFRQRADVRFFDDVDMVAADFMRLNPAVNKFSPAILEIIT